MTCLRLVLGDQLDPRHPWFASVRQDMVYVLMEMRQETDYVLHHAQKILAVFAAMRRFAEHLRMAGHRVSYLAIDAAGSAAVPVRRAAVDPGELRGQRALSHQPG